MVLKKEEFVGYYRWIEIALLFVCFSFSSYFIFRDSFFKTSPLEVRLLDLIVLMLIALWWNLCEHFTQSRFKIVDRGEFPSFRQVLICVSVLCIGIFCVNTLVSMDPVGSMYATLIFLGLSAGLLVLSNFLLYRLAVRHFNYCPLSRRVLIVGTGPKAVNAIQQELNKTEDCQVVAAVLDVDNREKYFRQNFTGIPFLPIEMLSETLRKNVVDEVIVALPIRSYYDLIKDTIEESMAQGISVTVYPAWDIEELSKKAKVTSVWKEISDSFIKIHTGSPLLGNPFYRLVKRLMDVTIAWTMLILLSPLMVCAAISIKLTSPGPVFFKQKRVGKGKRIFELYKFRTMYEDAEARIAELEEANITKGAAFKMLNDPRITPVGAFLRKTSIDELPQLFNVIKGDMSLVGPRPLPLRDYQRFYDEHHNRRFSVTPGITGLWQVSGRSLLSFEEWMALDLFYIDNWSLKLDLLILLKTIKIVLRGTGAM